MYAYTHLSIMYLFYSFRVQCSHPINDCDIMIHVAMRPWPCHYRRTMPLKPHQSNQLRKQPCRS